MKKLLILGILVLAVFSTSMAQTRQVTGKVTGSEDGAALPGVSVSLKGSTRGTTTAADGSYEITVGDDDAITFNFVGYKPQTVSVGNQSSINIALGSESASKWGWGIQNGLSLNSFTNEQPHTGYNVGYTGGLFIERNLGKNFYTRLSVGYTGAGGELVTFKDDTRYGFDPLFTFKNVKQSSYLLQSVDTYIDFIYKRKTSANWSYYVGLGGGMTNKFGEFEEYDKTGEFVTGVYGTVHNKQFTNRFENSWFNGNGLIGLSVPTKKFDIFFETKLILGLTSVRPNYSYIEYPGVTGALRTNALQFTMGITNLFKNSPKKIKTTSSTNKKSSFKLFKKGKS